MIQEPAKIFFAVLTCVTRVKRFASDAQPTRRRNQLANNVCPASRGDYAGEGGRDEFARASSVRGGAPVIANIAAA